MSRKVANRLSFLMILFFSLALHFWVNLDINNWKYWALVLIMIIFGGLAFIEGLEN